MAEGINAVRMTKKYSPFLPPGAKILNYSEKATGRPCDICHHVPEQRPPKPGYPDVSEEMRLMRVKLPEGTVDQDLGFGRVGFTVTGSLVELNICKDTANCFARAAAMTNDDGTPKYDSPMIQRYRL